MYDHDRKKKVDWGRVFYDDIDFLDVGISAAEGLTFGVGKMIPGKKKLLKYAIRKVIDAGATTLKAHYDVTPGDGWNFEKNNDPTMINRNVVSSIATENTIGGLYGLGENLVPQSKYKAINIFTKYLYKQLNANLNEKVQTAFFNDIMSHDNDYYYDRDNCEWVKIEQQAPFWINN